MGVEQLWTNYIELDNEGRVTKSAQDDNRWQLLENRRSIYIIIFRTRTGTIDTPAISKPSKVTAVYILAGGTSEPKSWRQLPTFLQQ